MLLTKSIYNYLYSTIYKAVTLENSATDNSAHILMDFPDELLIEIFKQLTFKELNTVALVSKKWNLITNNSPFNTKDLNHLMGLINISVFSKSSLWYSSPQRIGFYYVSNINGCLKIETSWYENNRQLDPPYKPNIVIEEIWTSLYQHRNSQVPLYLYYSLDFRTRIITPLPDGRVVKIIETALENIKAKVKKHTKKRF